MNAARDIDRPLVLLGAGGHAKVLLALALAAGHPVVGVCDRQLAVSGTCRWRGVPVLGGDEALATLDPQAYGLINGVGQMPKQDGRRRLYDTWRTKGFLFPALVHPFAWVADDAVLVDGVQVMAGVVIQPACTIGINTILNTGASVDHDCQIGAHVHIAPRAALCGGIRVDDGAYIGAGATVIHGMSIGRDAVVGAGVACVRNVAADEVVIGAAVRRPVKQLNS